MPTVGGVFLFVDQMRTGSPDSPLLPIFCILIMVCNTELQRAFDVGTQRASPPTSYAVL